MLFYDGKPITDAVAIDVALKNFIEWLKSRMPCILVAHNCKSFDARFLVQAAEKNGVIDDLAQTVSGFTDSLPAFRELLPERKSHSQENLVQDLLCKSYEAHNALADVQTLYQLVNKFLNVKLLQKHSFKVSWMVSYQKLLILFIFAFFPSMNFCVGNIKHIKTTENKLDLESMLRTR